MKDSVFFVIDTDDIYIDLSFLIYEKDLDDYTILCTDPANSEQYHVLFTKGRNDIFYGKFLENWNFDDDISGAIVGKLCEQSIDNIIGYVEDDGIYTKEHAVFLVDGKLSEINAREILTIACGRDGKAESLFEKLKEKCNEHGIELSRISVQSAVFGGYSKNEPIIIMIGLVFWGILCACYFVASFIWSISNRNYYRVLVMFGHRHPYIKITSVFMFTATMSFLLQAFVFIIIEDNSRLVVRDALLVSIIMFFSQFLILLHKHDVMSL